MTPKSSSSPSNETNATPAKPYELLLAEPVSLQALARSVQGPEWRALEALLGLERQKHLECLANPRSSEYWGAHRAIANWITEFTVLVRENILYLAKEQKEPRPPTESQPSGTPYMQHTADFDDEDLPRPPEPNFI